MAILKIYNPILCEDEKLDAYFFYGTDGTSFRDIDEFIASIGKDDDSIDIRLHSPGGNVLEGWAMVDKLRATGKQITATIEGECSSMATVILLAASVRRGARHARMLIHDPYIPEYALAGAYGCNADNLDKMARQLREEATRILDFYVERTGADRDELEALMKESIYIDMERAKELGFITEILEPISARARKKQPQTINTNPKQKSNMAKKKIDLLARVKSLAAKHGMELKGIVAYELQTAEGETITIDKPDGEDPAVGDAASPDGTHKMPDGKTIVIEDGVITEIISEEEETLEEELIEAYSYALQLEAENKRLRASARTDEDKQILNLVSIAGGIEWLKSAKSEYKPQGREVSGRSGKKEDPPAVESRTKKRLEELKAKNAQL